MLIRIQKCEFTSGSRRTSCCPRLVEMMKLLDHVVVVCESEMGTNLENSIRNENVYSL